MLYADIHSIKVGRDGAMQPIRTGPNFEFPRFSLAHSELDLGPPAIESQILLLLSDSCFCFSIASLAREMEPELM